MTSVVFLFFCFFVFFFVLFCIFFFFFCLFSITNYGHLQPRNYSEKVAVCHDKILLKVSHYKITLMFVC